MPRHKRRGSGSSPIRSLLLRGIVDERVDGWSFATTCRKSSGPSNHSSDRCCGWPMSKSSGFERRSIKVLLFRGRRKMAETLRKKGFGPKVTGAEVRS